jgi:F0F1-type ATP synthase membrane subunit b/b'
VYDKAAEVGTAIAGQILKREVTVDDQRGLVDRTLRELDRLPSN